MSPALTIRKVPPGCGGLESESEGPDTAWPAAPADERTVATACVPAVGVAAAAAAVGATVAAVAVVAAATVVGAAGTAVGGTAGAVVAAGAIVGAGVCVE